MRLSTWMNYNELFSSYSALFTDFEGSDLFIEEKKAEKKAEYSPSKMNHTPNKKQPLTPAQRRELARILAREIIFD